jgi:hypothetical protein
LTPDDRYDIDSLNVPEKGMGNGELGIGNWEWGIGKKREMYLADMRIAIENLLLFPRSV